MPTIQSYKNTCTKLRLLAILIVLFSCWNNLLAAENIIPLEIAPYITNVGKDFSVVNWRLKTDGESFIKYGLTTRFEIGTINTELGRQHSAELTSLAPNTSYHYNVNDMYHGKFTTDSEQNNSQFVALGHTHGTERHTQYPDKLLLSKISDLEPDFLVHMGDATFFSNYSDYNDYFFDYFSSLIETIPAYIAPGNHDSGWPFVYGRNLTIFKSLFNYPYPDPIQNDQTEAYYSIIKGATRFLFISYTSELGEGSKQRQWIDSLLSDESYTFNILVYGGAQTTYFDEDSFLEFLSNYKIDFILNGDGSQSQNEFLKIEQGIPVYFVGTSGGRPHNFLYIELQKNHLTLKRIDATGKMISAEWIYAKQAFEPKLDLLPISSKQIIGNELVFTFDPEEPTDSFEFSGLQIELTSKSDRTLVYAYILPADSDILARNNEGGFRTQYYDYSSTHDDLVTISFPQINPLKNQKYSIIKLRIFINALQGNAEDIEIEKMYLY